MGLANCIECGKVFAQTNEKLCPGCAKKRDNEIEKIREWISTKAHPKLSNIEKEISINEKIFIKHLLDGRIRDFSKVIVNCEMCNKEIRLQSKNVICNDCQSSFKKAQGFKKKGDLQDTKLYSKGDVNKFKKPE